MADECEVHREGCTYCVWNCVRGCAKVSAGCKRCYAERTAARFRGPGMPYEGLVDERGHWTGRARFVPEKLGDPLRWRKPRRVFVDSMSDLFHSDITDEQIAAVFGVMAACPQHTFQVLTKRPERMLQWFRWIDSETARQLDPTAVYTPWCTVQQYGHLIGKVPGRTAPWPLPNVWLGVSVEDQPTADERIPLLLQCPAAVRFVSYEPALGPVDFWGHFSVSDKHGEPSGPRCNVDGSPAIAWIVCGGESGARTCEVEWIRSVVEQCRESGVACFVKQGVPEMKALTLIQPDVVARFASEPCPCTAAVHGEDARCAFDPDIYECAQCGHLIGDHCGPSGECTGRVAR
jgi:protein gp37